MENDGWFESNFERLPDVDDDRRLEMTLESFDMDRRNGAPRRPRFLSGQLFDLAEERSASPEDTLQHRRPRILFTPSGTVHVCGCQRHRSPDTLVDDMHYSRRGTFLLGQYILAVFQGQEPVLQSEGAQGGVRKAGKKPASQGAQFAQREARKGQSGGERRAERAQRREERKKVRAARSKQICGSQ